jgi:hypothetical protein
MGLKGIKHPLSRRAAENPVAATTPGSRGPVVCEPLSLSLSMEDQVHCAKVPSQAANPSLLRPTQLIQPQNHIANNMLTGVKN